MVRLLTLIAVVLISLLSMTAQAATFKGTIKYTRVWEVNGCNNASRIKCSDNGTNKNYGPVVISARPGNGGADVYGTTNSAGAYTLTVPGGTTYQLRTHNRDNSLGNCTTNYGTASVAIIVSNDTQAGRCQEIVDNVGTAQNVNVGATVTYNPVISSGSVHDRANYYMAAMLQRDVWLGAGYSTTLLQNGFYKVRIQSAAGGASGGAHCFGQLDCVMAPKVNMALSSQSTLFHETGHGMQSVVQQQVLGVGKAWTCPQTVCSCVDINGTCNQCRAMEEAWAWFVTHATFWTPTTIPTNVIGQRCTNMYPPKGPEPFVTACGANAVPTTQNDLIGGFIDLFDANSVTNQQECVDEKVVVTPANMLTALTYYGTSGSCGSGQCVGTGEGGLDESCGCASSTPAYPYTGSNALPVVDQMSFLDYLAILKNNFGYSGATLRPIWANTGWARGDSLTTFVP